MNAKEFYIEFLKRAKESLPATIEQIPSFPKQVGWPYLKIYKEKEPAYTELVNKYIIHQIIDQAYPQDDERHLVAQHEYFRIDSIGYQHRYTEIPEKQAKEVGLNRHFWDLKIAVEHENSKTDWMDEVIKLTHIRCPLKVVIVYNHCDEREEPERRKLDFIAEWMQRVSAYHKDAEEFLIIIGNGAAKNRKFGDYLKFDYRGYLFDEVQGKFQRMILP